MPNFNPILQISPEPLVVANGSNTYPPPLPPYTGTYTTAGDPHILLGNGTEFSNFSINSQPPQPELIQWGYVVWCKSLNEIRWVKEVDSVCQRLIINKPFTVAITVGEPLIVVPAPKWKQKTILKKGTETVAISTVNGQILSIPQGHTTYTFELLDSFVQPILVIATGSSNAALVTNAKSA